MDKNAFDKQVMRLVQRSSNSGDMTNETGTRLIGHLPHLAPKAYLHIVYSALDETELVDLAVRLGKAVPSQFGQFLTNANGLSVFLDRIRVFGYVPLPPKRRASTHVHNYSTDVVLPNVSARVRGLRPNAIAVAGYRLDGSYVSIEQDGTAIRFDPKSHGDAIETWPDFDTWLISEISALSRAGVPESSS
jgi:hypothetical protein